MVFREAGPAQLQLEESLEPELVPKKVLISSSACLSVHLSGKAPAQFFRIALLESKVGRNGPSGLSVTIYGLCSVSAT